MGSPTREMALAEMKRQHPEEWDKFNRDYPPMDALLAERKTSHGEYRDDARCAMRLMDVLLSETHRRRDRGQPELLDIQRHALAMILHKIARIVAGDAQFKDHWDDIQGYAKLVVDRIEIKAEPVNGAEVLNLNAPQGYDKKPCHCGQSQPCMVDAGMAPKYVYCVRAENADNVGSIEAKSTKFDPFNDGA